MRDQRNIVPSSVGLILAGLLSGATLILGLAARVSAQVLYPSWSFTGNLDMARDGHTATRLQNGKVLVVGGNGAANIAELYDPATGTWSTTGSLNIPRTYQHTATLLQSGKVLVAGGLTNCGLNNCSILSSAELYDPVSGIWSVTGNLNTARRAFTATLLSNGKVLVAAGYNDASGDLNSAELFDPATGSWSYTGNLNTPRGIPTATLLPNGKVLIAGGEGDAVSSVDSRKALDSAELYDPSTGTWSSTGNLTTPREFHTATLLPNGNVLVAGGFNRGGPDNGIPGSAELYDPSTGTWSRTGNLSAGNIGHTATLLPNGKVVLVGSSLNVELYEPLTGIWSITAYLNERRSLHTATLLASGNVLVAGGQVSERPNTSSAELYDPGSGPASTLVDDAQFFVHQHYVDFLDRDPDAEGLAYWTNQIALCGSEPGCIHERRIGVSAAFFIELEFQESAYYVYRLYRASFGRQPDFAEFNSDRRSLGCDEDFCFVDYWVGRPAFLHTYPDTMSNTEFVNKLFDTAGLTAPIYNPQRQQQIQALNSGTSRAGVLSNVIEIPDFKNVPNPNDPHYSEIKQVSQYNPAFVLMQYFGYMRRNVDQEGYNYWLDVLNNREPNNYRAMVCAFLTSREYQHRFGSAVTRSNADCGQ